MSSDDEWKLPKRREVTDLEGKPALPVLPNVRGSFGPAVMDEPPLELEKIAKEDPPPPKRRSPIIPIAVLLVLAVGGFVGWKQLAHRTRPNAEIDLVNAPPDAKLLLDGAPIEGTHLVLPRSKEQHAITVLRPTTKPKLVHFTADEDTTLDLK